MNYSAKRFSALGLNVVVAAWLSSAFAAEVEPGFKSLFNSKDLTGWAGRPQHWSVQDGAITGVTAKDNPAQGNNFLMARDGDQNLVVNNFELRFSYRFTGEFGNSGVQYRSKDKGNFVVNGYQADFEVGPTYSGILYEEGGRGILCERGRKVVVKEADGKTKIETVGSLGESKEIQTHIKTNGWNDYVIIAQGNHLQHFINGQPTADVIDEQESKAARSGILALQIHAGPPMKIQFKDIRIKALPEAGSARGDIDLLQGEWVPVEAVANGQKVPPDMLAAIKLTIKGNDFVFDAPNSQSSGSFKLNETTQPKTMDATTSSGDDVPSIYEVTASSLKICYAIEGADRPTGFKSAESSNHFYTSYKRKQR